MGAWNIGPFDNDNALDYFDNLKERYVVDNLVNYPAIKVNFNEVLTGEESGEEEKYAVAGLVVAKLLNVNETSTGTNLFEPVNGLNLQTHCGALTLLDAVDDELLQNAYRCVSALEENKKWLNNWRDESLLIANLATLKNYLNTVPVTQFH